MQCFVTYAIAASEVCLRKKCLVGCLERILRNFSKAKAAHEQKSFGNTAVVNRKILYQTVCTRERFLDHFLRLVFQLATTNLNKFRKVYLYST